MFLSPIVINEYGLYKKYSTTIQARFHVLFLSFLFLTPKVTEVTALWGNQGD